MFQVSESHGARFLRSVSASASGGTRMLAASPWRKLHLTVFLAVRPLPTNRRAECAASSFTAARLRAVSSRAERMGAEGAKAQSEMSEGQAPTGWPSRPP